MFRSVLRAGTAQDICKEENGRMSSWNYEFFTLIVLTHNGSPISNVGESRAVENLQGEEESQQRKKEQQTPGGEGPGDRGQN